MRSTLSPPPLRVLIAEAHPIVVLGLTDLLHTLGYVLVGSVVSGQEALLAAAEHQPDLMLMDVDLKGEMDGIAAAVEIHNRLGIRCVFLAEHIDVTMRTRATEAGPVAILDKTSPMSVIADALRSAPSRNTIIGHDPGGQAMRTVLIATAASISCFLATGALAQTVNTQATTAASSAANAGAPPGR